MSRINLIVNTNPSLTIIDLLSFQRIQKLHSDVLCSYSVFRSSVQIPKIIFSFLTFVSFTDNSFIDHLSLTVLDISYNVTFSLNMHIMNLKAGLGAAVPVPRKLQCLLKHNHLWTTVYTMWSRLQATYST